LIGKRDIFPLISNNYQLIWLAKLGTSSSHQYIVERTGGKQDLPVIESENWHSDSHLLIEKERIQ
jgi:hypothetical protein